MNYAAAILAVTAILVPVFVILTAYLIYQVHTTQELIMAFKDDATTALATQSTAIDAAAARVAAATLAPADASGILSSIAANTAKINAIDPAAPPATPVTPPVA